MALGVMDIVSITRTQDYTTIKQNEDNKGMLQQTNIGQQFQKDTEQKTREVRKGDDTQWQNKKFDAKDKGSNEYSGNGGTKRRNPNNKDKVEQVIVNGHRGFDMKV